jgi:hypothetical protein
MIVAGIINLLLIKAVTKRAFSENWQLLIMCGVAGPDDLDRIRNRFLKKCPDPDPDPNKFSANFF